MNLFLDSSVVLCACESASGASRFVIEVAKSQGWCLQISPYVEREVETNLSLLKPPAAQEWIGIRAELQTVPDVLTFPWVVVFSSGKDRPILFTAAASCEVLLTLDQKDFTASIGDDFYGLQIARPGSFLRTQRESGRFKPAKP